jgi:hypothetical protein
MKHSTLVMLLCTAIATSLLARNMADDNPSNVSLEDVSADIITLSERDYTLLTQDIDYVYVPEDVKRALKDLAQLYPEALHPDVLLTDDVHVAPELRMNVCLDTLLDVLDASGKHEEAVALLRVYHQDLQTGRAFIFIEEDEDDSDMASHDGGHRKKKCEAYCSLLVCNGLRAGAMLVTGNAAIGGSITVDGAIHTTYSGYPVELPEGLNGQLLIGNTGGPAQFNTVTSPNNSVIFTPGPGTLDLKVVPSFGNIARVDQIFGNDSTGAVSGPPFATIGAALAAAGTYATATTPVVVWVFPGVYSDTAYYPETFPLTIPNNVSLVGISPGGAIDEGGVTIEKVNANAALTLINMEANTMLENVTVHLTGGTNQNLVGINVATGPATIDRVNVIVDNQVTTGIQVVGTDGATITIDTVTVVAPGASNFSTGLLLTGGASVQVLTSNSNITVHSSNGFGAFFENFNGSFRFQDLGSTFQGIPGIALSSHGPPNVDASKIILLGTTLITNPLPTTATNLPVGVCTPGCSPTILVWNIYQPSIIFPTSFFTGILPGSNASSTSPVKDTFTGYAMPQQTRAVRLYFAATAGSGVDGHMNLLQNNDTSSLSVVQVDASGTGGSNTTAGLEVAADNVLRVIFSWTPPPNAARTLHYPMVSCVVY